MMSIPLVTTGYDHVVLIDSQVVLEGRPLEQLPWHDLFPGSVLLLAVRQVQTEVDRKKNDGRLGKRARAFNRLLDGFIESRVPSSVLNSPKIDVATVGNRSINWDDLDDLDRDDGDDRIVAQALNVIIDDPTRLVLLSHDMRPRDAAAAHGLRALKLPEAWLREPEPSPEQKRVTELEEKVRLLAADQPKLVVRIELLTPEPWTYREVMPPAPEQIEAMLRRRLAGAHYHQQSPFSLGVDLRDHSYDGRWSAWHSEIRQEIPRIHRGLTKLCAQQRVRVTIENTGHIPAENLSLEIYSGNSTLHSRPYQVLLLGRGAPMPRNSLYGMQIVHPRDIRPRREPFGFYWDEEGPGNSISQSCASFRQKKKHTVDASVELLSRTSPKLQIEAIATASNMKGMVHERLLVAVEAVEIPFDDIYDAAKRDTRIGLPFNLTEDRDIGECVLVRNGGQEYEPD